MLVVSCGMLIILCSVRTPVNSAANGVGKQARTYLKLGNTLDQVHSDLIKDKTKGMLTKEDTIYNAQNPNLVYSL